MFKASINWLHFGVLRLHVAEEMVAPRPDCAIPKISRVFAARSNGSFESTGSVVSAFAAAPKCRPRNAFTVFEVSWW